MTAPKVRPCPTTVRMESPLRTFLKREARKQGCSMSFKITQILEDYKAAQERDMRPEGETREILR